MLAQIAAAVEEECRLHGCIFFLHLSSLFGIVPVTQWSPSRLETNKSSSL